MASTKERSAAIQALRGSLEMGYVRRNILFCLAMLPVSGLVFLIKVNPVTGSLFWQLMGIMLLAISPFLLFYLIRILRIYRKPERYVFSKVELRRPYHSFNSHVMYFSILVENSEGRKIPADTHAIFATRGLIGPLMEEYVNRTVTVAYNEDTKMVVVIG